MTVASQSDLNNAVSNCLSSISASGSGDQQDTLYKMVSGLGRMLGVTLNAGGTPVAVSSTLSDVDAYVSTLITATGPYGSEVSATFAPDRYRRRMARAMTFATSAGL